MIATKVFGEMGPGPNDRGASRGHIMDSVQAAWSGCRPTTSTSTRSTATTRVTPIDETLRALDDLIRQGLVRYVGVSNWAAWKIAKALGLSEAKGYARFETLQAYYSIAGRDLERELVPHADGGEARPDGLVAAGRRPAVGQVRTRRADPEGARRASFDFPPVDTDRAWACVAAMREIGEAHGVSVARVALAWLLAKPHVMSIIIGAKTVEQLDDNLAAAELGLTAEEIARLDEVSALPPEYPGWMFGRQGGHRRPKPFTPKKS